MKIEKSRRVVESRPVCRTLIKKHVNHICTQLIDLFALKADRVIWVYLIVFLTSRKSELCNRQGNLHVYALAMHVL
jgi:hypothetical protein